VETDDQQLHVKEGSDRGCPGGKKKLSADVKQLGAIRPGKGAAKMDQHKCVARVEINRGKVKASGAKDSAPEVEDSAVKLEIKLRIRTSSEKTSGEDIELRRNKPETSERDVSRGARGGYWKRVAKEYLEVITGRRH